MTRAGGCWPMPAQPGRTARPLWRCGARAGLARPPASPAAAGRRVLDEAGLEGRDLGGVAYTAGPGLIGALLVGATAGRAWPGLGLPAIAVHHMEAHLLAPLLEDAAAVSLRGAAGVRRPHHAGRCAAFGAYDVLGQTLDDAAGEAFDKTAKLLGLPTRAGRSWPAGRTR